MCHRPGWNPQSIYLLSQCDTLGKMNTHSHTPKGDNVEEVQKLVNEIISHCEAK